MVMEKNMLQEFITQNYLIIEQNIVTNVCVWDGDTTIWTPPQGSIALVQTTTPAMVWELNADKTDYVLTEQIGAGSINFTWDGTNVITNEPKPEAPKPQPTTEGIISA
jgi:hypothetical protein